MLRLIKFKLWEDLVMKSCIKKILSLTIIISLVVGLFPMGGIVVHAESWREHRVDTFSAGDGTVTSPYEISTPEELALLSYKCNEYDNNYLSAYYKLTADIDLSGYEWAPIPVFDGVFDGDNFTISNLSYGTESSYADATSHYGLFASSYSGAILKNINVHTAIYSDSLAYNCYDIGGLVGHNNGTIVNCHSSGVVNSNSYRVGGLIGNNTGDVSFSSSDSLVDNSDYSYGYIGGLIGFNSFRSVYNSSFEGKVIASNSTTGGLIGFAEYATVDFCSVNAEMEDSINSGFAGGLVGYLEYSTVQNSFAKVDISYREIVGGLIGFIDGVNIKNCYATGNVSGDYSGGLIGSSEDSVIESCYAAGEVTGGMYEGGIVGEISYSDTFNCYYNSDVIDIGIGDGEDLTIGLTSDIMKAINIEPASIEYQTNEGVQTAESFIEALNLGKARLGEGKFYVWVEDEAEENSGYPVFYIPELESIEVRGENGAEAITEDLGSLQMEVLTTPADVFCLINWEITDGEEYAQISQDGLLTSLGNNGTVEVTATYMLGESISDSCIIEITNQCESWLLEENIADSFDGGLGTQEDPYQIASGAQLAYLAKLVNDIELNDEGEQYNTLHYILTDDIDLSGKRWTPIGINSNDSIPFCGVFDGNNKKVSGLVINEGVYYTTYDLGLFGLLENARVEDLTIENANIKWPVDNYVIVGTLAGEAIVADIVNCHASVDIEAKGIIGGLVAIGVVNIENCSTSGTITGIEDSDVGGLILRNYILEDIESGVISNSNSSCELIGQQGIYAGGLVGENEGLIENCYATGNINVGDNSFVGGLATVNFGLVEDCYATGNIEAGDSSFAGGLVAGNVGIISECYYNGSITSDGGLLAGGLISQNLGLIEQCYAETEILCGGNESYLGGLVGANGEPDGRHKKSGKQKAGKFEAQNGDLTDRLKSSYNIELEDKIINKTDNLRKSIKEDMKIVDSYAIGKIICDKTATIGGLAGVNEGDIENCYFKGDVTSGDESLVGGLTGISASESELQILNCYAEANVTGGIESYIGGFSGLVAMEEDAIRIKNCNSLANVVGGAESYIGGFIGGAMLDTEIGQLPEDINQPLSISGNYAKGSVEGGDYSVVGGFVGATTVPFNYCYSMCDVYGGYGAFVGGLVGANGTAVANSFSIGNVMGDGEDEGKGGQGMIPFPSSAGGFAGANFGLIQNSYARGDVINGDDASAGGFIGINFIQPDVVSGIVEDCYSAGNVTGADGSRVGGFAGENYSEITNCYYNTDYIQTIDGEVQEAIGTGMIVDGEAQPINIINGLKTSEMTGIDAIGEDNLNFEAENWLTCESENGKIYYPQISSIYTLDFSDDYKEGSLTSATFSSKPPEFKKDLTTKKTVTEGDDITLKVSVQNSDESEITYQWYKNGKILDEETTDTLTINNVKTSDGGKYYVVATNNIFDIQIANTKSNECQLTVKRKQSPSGGGGAGTITIHHDDYSDGSQPVINSNTNINTYVPYYIKDGREVIVPLSKIVSGSIQMADGQYAGLAYKDNKKSYSDIKGHWAYDAIDFVTARELFAGTGADEFSPDGKMTRGMLVTVLGRLWGVDASGYASSGFSDVNNDLYYAPYIEWAAQNGIVSGVGDNMFDPERPIVREELATMVDRFIGFSGLELSLKKPVANFTDSSRINEWAKQAIVKLQTAGIINGMPDNRFAPRDTATRAEVATILKGLIENLLD